MGIPLGKPILIMIAKFTTGVVLFALLLPLVAQPAHAQTKLAGMSATAFTPSLEEMNIDHRGEILKAYLISKDSPLADHADTFVHMADKYNLDWKLVAAIAGLESGYGKAIPTGSYNGWGWGVYGINVHYFTSWDDGIEEVSQGLKERYIKDAKEVDIYAIGKTYAASPTWAVRVIANMNAIDTFASDYTNQHDSKTLPLSI